ncbi:hypothetical protein SAMN05216559_3560 [Halomicrobium zhouii]|uniref:Uncharacterized protein n=1 Tax=Halomicrobium zhouii TaxID=767519 RepID=A0A1I6M1V4_9EURY|nr:hypothetical protein [Halomicrobium zhouii]SFS09675.1 hypothetical protein SAMN05216559_3560 [Halomicrobium zhouii]
MAESSPDESDAARMMLEPDAIHEGNGGPSIDCPQCGATNTLVSIVEEGRCTGVLDDDAAEVESEDEQLQQGGCGAKLSLELVWAA